MKEQHAEQTDDSIDVTCPYCRSTDTEFFSLFGQQLLTMQYYCNACHTPFEHVKDHEILYTKEVVEKTSSL